MATPGSGRLSPNLRLTPACEAKTDPSRKTVNNASFFIHQLDGGARRPVHSLLRILRLILRIQGTGNASVRPNPSDRDQRRFAPDDTVLGGQLAVRAVPVCEIDELGWGGEI